MSYTAKATGQNTSYVVLSTDSKKIIWPHFTKSHDLAHRAALVERGIVTSFSRAEKLGLPVHTLTPYHDNTAPRIKPKKIVVSPQRKAASAFIKTGEKAVRAVARAIRTGAALNESQQSVLAAVGKFPDAAL